MPESFLLTEKWVKTQWSSFDHQKLFHWNRSWPCFPVPILSGYYRTVYTCKQSATKTIQYIENPLTYCLHFKENCFIIDIYDSAISMVSVMSENIKLLKCHFLVKSIHARRLVFINGFFAPVMNEVNLTWVMINSQQCFIDFPYHYKIIYDAYLVFTHCTTLHFMNFDMADHTWGCWLQVHCGSSVNWFNS